MRGSFALTSRSDANVAGALTMFGEVRGAEVAEAALDATGEGTEDLVHRAGDFLERFDAFGGDLAELAAGGMAVAGGGTLPHGFVRTHAAVFLISLTVDLHQLARGFAAAGEQAAEDDRVGERERLDDVAALRDAAVGEDTHALLGGGAGGDVKRGELRDADTGDDAGRADRAGALANLDGIRARGGEELDAFAAGDIASDERDALMGLAQHAERVADALGVAVGGGNREGVRAFVDKGADVRKEAGAVDFAFGRAGDRDGDADAETEVGIAGRADVGAGLFGDTLDVAEGEKASQLVLRVDHEELVLADVFGELAVGGGDRVLAEILLRDGEDLVTRDHDRDDLALAVAFLDRAAGQESEERSVGGRHREGAEGEAVAFDAGEDLADGIVGRDHRGVANHSSMMSESSYCQLGLMELGWQE